MADWLDAIEQRAAKATEGPWAWESVAEKSNEFVVGIACDANGKLLEGELPDDEWVEDAILRRQEIGSDESGQANFADADFIAYARMDISRLIKRLRAAERVIAESRAKPDRYGPYQREKREWQRTKENPDGGK